MTDPRELRDTAEAAWSWVLGQVREDDGPWLPEWVRDGENPTPTQVDRDALYCGVAGLAPVLAELALVRPLSDPEVVLGERIARRLRDLPTPDASLYVGAAGHACALRLLGIDAEPVMERLVASAGPDGWPSPEDDRTYVNDVIAGTAGIVLTGAWLGGEQGHELASLGADRLLRAAEPVGDGLDWPMSPGYAARMPNLSHGTAGIAAALAVAGTVLGRADLRDAAVRGARHLLTLADLRDGGFALPLVIPPQVDREPVSYGWCHGPTGTSYLFAALERAGVDHVDGHPPAELRARCITTVLRSGVPERRHPGFWDNDARCCGTAGVGAMLLDSAQDADDPAYAEQLVEAAVVMAEAIVSRAVLDGAGTRWRSVEHRDADPLLPPNTTWMQGAAGISAFLLRLARVLEGGLRAPVVDLPDQWWAVPSGLRTTRHD